MAWTEKRPGGYIGRYRDPAGRTRSTSVLKRKRDAQDAADRQEQAVRRDEWTNPTLGHLPVSEWATVWLGSLSVTPKTRHGYEERLSSLILPTWGATRLSDVTLTGVKAWLSTLTGPTGRPASATRKRDAGAQLVRMLDAAVDEGRLRRNPARTPAGKVGYLPRATAQKEHRYLTHDELHALATACGTDATFVLFAGYTGLRWGEVTALRVGDFAMLTGRVSVVRAYSSVGGKAVLGNTKTHERRTVVVPPFLRDDLARLMEGRGRDDLVFTAAGGGPLNIRNWPRRVLEPAWQVAGIQRLTFHDLRHTAASLAVAAGANVKVVQKMLGHASASMTLDTYAGLFDDDLNDVAEAMNQGALASRAHYLPTETREVVRSMMPHGDQQAV